jgi:REP element-mobilizing transposase RayT
MSRFLRPPSPPRHLHGPGLWFITVSVWGAEPVLGVVAGGSRVALSPIGRIALRRWAAIPEHFAAVRLHAFVVMPNHLHGIIELTSCSGPAATEAFGKPAHGSIATIVRSFKAATTREVRELLGRPVTVWHGRDHVRRLVGRDELDRAAAYIERNPARGRQEHPAPRQASSEPMSIGPESIESVPVARPAVAQPPVAQPAVARPAVAQPAVAQPAVARPAPGTAFAVPSLARHRRAATWKRRDQLSGFGPSPSCHRLLRSS